MRLRFASQCPASESRFARELSVAMKRSPYLVTLLFLFPLIVGAQVQNRERRSSDRESPATGESAPTRDRVVSTPKSNHAESDRTSEPKSISQERPRWGNTSVERRSSAIERPASPQASNNN